VAKGAAVVGAAVARVALGAVFVYAGVLKALAPDDFTWAILHYRLLPYPAAAALALYLPWLEILCGAGLAWSRTRVGALSLLFGLCVIFAGALASAWVRRLDLACGCFGGAGAGAESVLFRLARAGVLAALSGFLLGRELPPPPAAAVPGAHGTGRG